MITNQLAGELVTPTSYHYRASHRGLPSNYSVAIFAISFVIALAAEFAGGAQGANQ